MVFVNFFEQSRAQLVSTLTLVPSLASNVLSENSNRSLARRHVYHAQMAQPVRTMVLSPWISV